MSQEMKACLLQKEKKFQSLFTCIVFIQLSIFRKYAIDTTDSNLQLQLNKCRINDKKYLFLHRIDDDSIDSIDYPIIID